MEFNDVINGHRSIREYEDREVGQDLLGQILEAGIRASSSGNMQSYSIIVTRDQELKNKLYAAHMEQSMVVDAPVLLTFCADFNRMRKWLALHDAPVHFDNFMSFMIGAIDATLASQNCALAAENAGLGICYMGSTLANCDQIGKLLNLPPNVVPVVGYSLGYPAENPPLRDRLPKRALVHEEQYRDYSDEDILDLYSERNEKGWKRYMDIPELKEMTERLGLQNLAQIYTRAKYTKESHLEFSQTVLNYLESQNFMKNS
ncbi:nitroreductase family protein [Paenibacillus sacheonensis]|uniref:NADPH-dependent oxidoreductase n=1 Tax=Paenibacillus sacheonensis TaxID=742054 RepID=A0A7X4YUZ2_9BACL|nr:nitroreductase family protein [Paenibacillus sacheonensis]MBM7567775.1 nitroreductase [Paenibacillus sacheonensis]NBC71954.1 NADPH-dependent oxidoreductase [Paenibacillus sacheonensis]